MLFFCEMSREFVNVSIAKYLLCTNTTCRHNFTTGSFNDLAVFHNIVYYFYYHTQMQSLMNPVEVSV